MFRTQNPRQHKSVRRAYSFEIGDREEAQRRSCGGARVNSEIDTPVASGCTKRHGAPGEQRRRSQPRPPDDDSLHLGSPTTTRIAYQ